MRSIGLSVAIGGLMLTVAFGNACGDDVEATSGGHQGGHGGGGSAAGGDGGEAPEVICDDVVGLRQPLPECSESNPCNYVAAEVSGPILTPSDPPQCADPDWEEMLTWTVDATPRYACLHRPGNIASGPRPLVVFFHPGGNGADVVEMETSLLAKAESYDLGDTGGLGGFVLAVVQGRNLHFPTTQPRDGRHHDFYHRDLASPSTNPDIQAADALIDMLAASGEVETDRIYVMGWSNGAFFSQLYAIARHETATLGGHRVAAAAAFAAASPFDDIERDPFAGAPHQGPSCKLASLPTSPVPIQLTYRSCDLATPCGSSDAACFGQEPGYVTTDWLAAANVVLPNLDSRRIGGVELGPAIDTEVSSCTNVDSVCNDEPCGVNPTGAWCLCLVNHLRWPDGVYGNGSGVDNEPAMLDFLRAHPHPGGA